MTESGKSKREAEGGEGGTKVGPQNIGPSRRVVARKEN